MAQINKPNQHFNTITWTADGTSPRSFTGVGFQPDLVWGKRRSVAADHNLFDVVRGVGSDKAIMSNSNDAEGSASPSFGYLSSLDSDGFTVTTGSTNNNYWNNGTDTYVGWNWKAGGTASSNTDGSITTNVSVNTTAGFSIVTYTGTGSNATIGHGLGVKPDAVFFKRLDTTGGWASYHSVLGATKYMRLDSDSGEQTATDEFQNTEPTSSVISIGTDGAVNGTSMVAYCFADVKGFSKVGGSYVGNSNADGTFVYTGFKPAWLMVKRSSSSGTDWYMFDNKRNTFNVTNSYLDANTSDAELSNISFDFTSNGFKLRDSQTIVNGSGSTFIYMAFAENPLVGTNNIPATAR